MEGSDKKNMYLGSVSFIYVHVLVKDTKILTRFWDTLQSMDFVSKISDCFVHGHWVLLRGYI